MREPGIVNEERHESVLMKVGAFILVLTFSGALTLLAWAIWQIASALALAVVAVGMGASMALAATGAARLVEAIGRARADIIEAQGRARAALERERLRAQALPHTPTWPDGSGELVVKGGSRHGHWT